MTAVYWTQGQYDLVAITDWPDEETATAFTFQVCMAGNVRMETLRAFDEAAMQCIVAKIAGSDR